MNISISGDTRNPGMVSGPPTPELVELVLVALRQVLEPIILESPPGGPMYRLEVRVQ